MLSITVLVVDDNTHMRSILKELLRAMGVANIREASDAVEAFEILKSNEMDLIIADVSMPIIDGVEFTRMLRNNADSANPYVPILIVSGHSERSRVFAARDAGCTEFLVKPITANGLFARIVAIVERPRPFVRTPTFFGPDRRRRTPKDYAGPFRRKDDVPPSETPATES